MNETPTATAISTPDITGKRVIAAIIDMIIMVVVLVIFSSLSGGTDTEGSSVSVNVSGLPAVLYFLFALAYYIGLEFKTGKTVGKMAMGLKVVAINGEYSLGKAAIRNVLRIVDGLPVFYLVGFIAMVASKQKQRIGDMAAGTIVVEG